MSAGDAREPSETARSECDAVAGAQGGTLIALPAWVPESVVNQVRSIEARCEPGRDHAILCRLATDPRMRNVWTTLMSKTRSGSKKFVHPVRPAVEAPPLPEVDAQEMALGETVHFAFCAARDELAVSKPDEITPARERFAERARILRNVAAELLASVAANPWQDPAAVVLCRNDAEALNRVAEWQEAQIPRLRGPDDPLSISNERGDRVERGVASACASFLKDRFGGRLDGTAATLASVALATDISERIPRSAFSRPKPTKTS